MSARSPFFAAAVAIATTLVATACSGAGQGDLHDTIEQVRPTSSPSAGAAATNDGGAPQPTVGSAGRPADQFKTSAQLGAAIATCFGGGVTTVTAAMVQSAAGTSVTGFLSPSDFAAGDDVIARQVLVFDGDPAVARTGVRDDTVSLPLLAALQNVGNVVGGNCAASLAVGGNVDAGATAAPSLCACSTPDTALAMLARCLPSVDPSAYASVVDGFAASCAADDAAAVASLVASTTFGAQ
jgi:hypothetical protein